MSATITYYRNYTSDDATMKGVGKSNNFASINDVGGLDWTQENYNFIEWNTSRDGTGTSYAPGDTAVAVTVYAQWSLIPSYTVSSTSLTSIADAIRTKGGTSASLTYPSGFISAINAISGGSTDIEDGLVTRTISGVYSNSRVTTIGDYAFISCANLTTANFPNTTTIGNYAFQSCTSLTTASFPSATTISSYAFAYCANLTTVSFPNATTISQYAFDHCSSLTTANFPNTTTIGNYAFQSCRSLTTVSFSNATSISIFAFGYCSSLTTVSFPKVTYIGNYAFSGCRSLTTASFPAATEIGNYAFRNCYNLISLYLSGSSVVTLKGSAVFSSTPIGGYSTSAGRYGSVFVPTSLLTSYKAATYWSLISARIVGY